MVGTAKRSRLLDKKRIRTGDQILLTKALAVEGTAILAREFPQALARLGLTEDDISRSAQFLFSPGISVLDEAGTALESGGVSALHDVTEGGVATALEELTHAGRHRIRIRIHQVPVFPETARICRLLGIDPLGLIGSGSLLIVCRADSRERLQEALGDRGLQATLVGEVLGPGSGVEAVDGNGEPHPWPRFETDELPRAIEKLQRIKN
jgi:hydrogenase maturation factor